MAVQLGYKNVYRDPKGYPEWQKIGLPLESAPEGLAKSQSAPDAPGPLYGWPMIWTLLAIFVGGMALNLTPCVYPLIPVTVSYFGIQAASRKQGQQSGLIIHGLGYIIGLAVTNSALGVGAALTGGLMGATLQNPMVLVAMAVALTFFATSLFGLWELRLPSRVAKGVAKTHAGYFGSLFMGLTLGMVAAPCIGPFVLGLLTWVASTGSAWLGFLVFFILSLGLGLPLFFLAMFSGQLKNLPLSGGWMLWVRKLMGWVLVGMAGYFVRPLLPESWGILILAAIALSAGVHLGWLDSSQASFRTFPWLKIGVTLVSVVTATILITSWVMRGPGVAWQSYSDQMLAEGQKLKKPVIIDFYASWCTPCRELEEVTFHNPAVVQKAATDFIMIKVDLTRSSQPGHEQLLQKYGVKGVPTVVFLDEDGKEKHELRLVDYLPPDQFLNYMVALEPNSP